MHRLARRLRSAGKLPARVSSRPKKEMNGRSSEEAYARHGRPAAPRRMTAAAMWYTAPVVDRAALCVTRRSTPSPTPSSILRVSVWSSSALIGSSVSFARVRGRCASRSTSHQSISGDHPRAWANLVKEPLMGTRLYVGNLPFSADGAQPAHLFDAYGEVAEARVITDRESGRS